MLRKELLESAPEILQGKEIDIEYVSPLARAQKSSSLNGTMKALEILLPLAQAIPVADHLNPDGLVNHVMESLGVPKKVVKPQDQVDAEREQKAIAQQEQMERQQEQEDVMTAAQGAQAVRMLGN